MQSLRAKWQSKEANYEKYSQPGAFRRAISYAAAGPIGKARSNLQSQDPTIDRETHNTSLHSIPFAAAGGR